MPTTIAPARMSTENTLTAPRPGPQIDIKVTGQSEALPAEIARHLQQVAQANGNPAQPDASTTINHALAHDLKNLLHSIMGYASILEISETLSPEEIEFANGIVAIVQRANHLIDYFLDLAATNQTRQSQPTAFNLVDAVARAIADLQGTALAKSIALDFQVVGYPYPITGDEFSLYRCALNLLDNAIKYSPQHAHVSLTITFGDSQVIIQVRDTGAGIPAEDLPHIFDKFYRGRQSAGPQAGVGLGLAMVQAIVEAHGGTISARNIEGHGAQFTIAIPT